MNIRYLTVFLFCCGVWACSAPLNKSTIDRKAFQKTIEGKKVDLFTLKNKNGVLMRITNYGARIVSLMIPDQSGRFDDVVLGYNRIEDYLTNKEQYFGATIGRYGNRIAKGEFSLNNQTYHLALNNLPNSLHGGIKGFSAKVWDADQLNDQELTLTLTSPDMEEGYPGALKVMVKFRLTDKNEVEIYYSAKSDKPTVINLTNHSYFNLHGAGHGDILNHVLYLNANRFTPVDSTLIPTGELASVTDTPFDFTTPTMIGSRLERANEQLKFGKGYDHNFVLNKKPGEDISLAASVFDPLTGRLMEVFTNEPGIQFYGGNFLKGEQIGKEGVPYGFRSAFCLETQHFPDSPNHPEFPTVVLNPGAIYQSVCVYRFSIR